MTWSSLKWRRQILSLLYFHHVFYQFPSLLIRFKFNVSLSCRHPSSIVLPRSGAHFLKSPLFSLSVEWNKLPEHIRCVQTSVNFRIALKAHYSQHRYSLTGIPNFSVLRIFFSLKLILAGVFSSKCPAIICRGDFFPRRFLSCFYTSIFRYLFPFFPCFIFHSPLPHFPIFLAIFMWETSVISIHLLLENPFK